MDPKLYPKIDLHCPFKARFAEAMEGDVCRICDHVVHDLDAMAPDLRREFLGSTGKVCVRYRMPVALMAGALAALPVAAQEAPASDPQAAAPAEEWESAEIVGVMVRFNPCDRMETVGALRPRRDDDACYEKRHQKWEARREARRERVEARRAQDKRD
jgi:hypothetical protein